MTINLIPPKLKRQKAIKEIFGQINFGFASALIMILVLSLALFVYDRSIRQDIIKSNDKLAEQEKRLRDYKSLEASIRQANSQLDKINEILPERALWSETITQISAYTPKNIQIKAMDLNKESGNAVISGTASTRKEIALFKEKLEQNGFKNVTFSSSSYNQNTDDYTFSLSFEIGAKK